MINIQEPIKKFYSLTHSSFKVIYDFLINKIKHFKLEVKSLKYHLKNLKEENFNLAYHHLSQKNFYDVKLRLWIINKFISPNDPEIKNIRLWLNILENKIPEALQNLEDLRKFPHFVDEEFAFYLDNYKDIHTIPDKVSDKFFSMTSLSYDQKYIDSKNSLINSFIYTLMPFLPNKSENGSYSILDIGGTGIVACDLKSYLPKNSKIHSVDFLNQRFLFAKSIFGNDTDVYNSITLTNREELSYEAEPRFNLVISFDSFSDSLDLQEYFGTIRDYLFDENSIGAICLPHANKTKLNISMNHFEYDISYVEDQLKLAELNLETINVVTFEKRKFLILVVS